MSHILSDVKTRKKEEYLSCHPYHIWQDKEGKYCTYLSDETKPTKRRLIRRLDEEKLHEVIMEYWKGQEDNPTVKDIFYEWIGTKLSREEISRATYDRYVSDFGRFFMKMGKKYTAYWNTRKLMQETAR